MSDTQRRELAELGNTADGLIYSVEQALVEYGEQLDDGEREEVKQGLDRAQEATRAQDLEALREAVEELQQIAYRMTEVMYERLQES